MADQVNIVFIVDNHDELSTAPLIESMSRLIEDIPDNSFVGVVLFDNRTQIRNKLIQITGDGVRKSILDNLHKSDTQHIDIEAGLQAGLSLVNECGQISGETTFILVVKHKDRNGFYVDKMVPLLLPNKIKVNCIAIGHDADEHLELLARKTNGQTFFANDSSIRVSAVQSLFNVNQSEANSDVITICNETIVIKEKKFTKSIIVDSDIGRNVVFQVMSKNIRHLSCELNSPLSDTSIEMTSGERLNRLSFKTNEAESGNWTMIISNSSQNEVVVDILVKCEPLEENPIRMSVHIIEPDVYNPYPPIIVAELTKGADIVIGAEVKALVDCPDGTQKKISLKNFEDTIYCNHFTDYRGAGRYCVTVLAINTDDDCVLLNAVNKSPVNGEVPAFERQERAGSFLVTDAILNVSNLKPPIELKQKLMDLSSNWTLKGAGPFNIGNKINSKIMVPTPFALAKNGLSSPLKPLARTNINTPSPSLITQPKTPTLLSSTPTTPQLIRGPTHTPPIPTTPSIIMASTSSTRVTPLQVPKIMTPSTPTLMTAPTPLSLNTSFTNIQPLNPNSGTQNQSPKPLTRTLKPNNESMSQIEGTILQSLLVVKKSINSKKISDQDRIEMKKSIITIDSYLSSKNKTVQQLKSYQTLVDEMKNKFI